MNKHRGYVPIEIDGEEYSLRLDFNALASLDQRLGRSVLQALAEGSFYAIQQCIAVGLQNPRNPRDAVKAVRKLDAAQLEYYVECIIAALEAAGVIKLEEEDEDQGEGAIPQKKQKKEADGQ